jgi:hypothetical protein
MSLTAVHDDVGQCQHSAGDHISEDHMKKKGISCQVEFGKCGNVADGIKLIHE